MPLPRQVVCIFTTLCLLEPSPASSSQNYNVCHPLKQAPRKVEIVAKLIALLSATIVVSGKFSSLCELELQFAAWMSDALLGNDGSVTKVALKLSAAILSQQRSEVG